MIASRVPAIENDFLRLSFDPEDGRWLELCWRPSNLNLINHEARPRPTCDFRFNGRWVRDRHKTRLISVEQDDGEDAQILRLTYHIGRTRQYQVCRIPRYTLEVTWTLDRSRPLIRRSAAISLSRRSDYYGIHRERLTGVRFVVPGVSIGDPIACTFEAPGERYRPRTPYRIRARLRRNSAEGKDDFFSLLSAPDLSTGLLAIHNIKRDLSLLTGYETDSEPAFPAAWGKQGILHLEHRHGIAGDIVEGQRVEAGNQIMLVCAGNWNDARETYRKTIVEPLIPLPGDRPDWVRNAIIGEVDYHVPGGIAAMRKALPGWADLGINTLYLMATNPGGYGVQSFEGIAEHLGDEEDLKALVKEAHLLGMRVILDFLMTIQDYNGDLVRQHPDWFVRDRRGRVQPSIAWGGCSVDWDHPDFQEYRINLAVEQVKSLDIDGYRVDAPEHKEVNWGVDPPRRASDTSFGAYRLLEKLRPALKAVKPDVALLSETHGPLFHRVTDFSYAHPGYGVDWLISAIESGRFTGRDLRNWIADQKQLLPADVERVFLVKSHDVSTNFVFANHPSQQPLQFLFSVIRGGVMVYLSDKGTHEPVGPEMEFCGEIFRLRNTLPDLLSAGCDMERPGCDNENIFCAWRETGNRIFVPAANLSGIRQNFRFDLPENASEILPVWPEGEAIQVKEGRAFLELEPWDCVLWEVTQVQAETALDVDRESNPDC